MKAAVLRELGKPLTIEDLQVPPLGKGQVLVRVQLAGVCPAQKLEVSGGRGVDRYLPHVVGHEGVGVVLDVGPGVTKVKPQQQVVLSWIRGSGEPSDPIVYRSAQGPVNAGPVATFCETPIVSQQCVVAINPPVKPEVAVLAGCAIPTGAGTVWNALSAKSDGSICILGAGGVGLSAVAGAAYSRWGTIAAADLRLQRLKRAKELGATHTIHISPDLKQENEKMILAVTQGKGFDLVVECAGTVAAMEMAVRLAKAKDGKVVIAGNLRAGEKISIDPMDLIQGRWLGGSWGGWTQPDKDIPMIVERCLKGSLPYTLLQGKTFRIDQVNEALNELSGEDPGRPILVF